MRILVSTLLAMMTLAGCVKRTISITSDPGGALVWVNDREVGRTPLEIGFLYYVEYDVRVERDGQEPIMTTRWASAPSWDVPVVDLAVESFSKNKKTVVLWHFDMEQRNDDPELLLQRASHLRNAVLGDDNE